MKKIWKSKKIFAMLLAGIMLFGIAVPSSAATPSLSGGAYMKTYVLSTSNNTPVYTSASLKKRGTSSPYKAYNATIYANDEVYVYSMNATYSYISYPVGGTRRRGYVKTSAITSNNYSVGAKTSKAYIKVSRRAGSIPYGNIDKGDTVYTMASSGNYIQVAYPVGNNVWKAGWITKANYNAYIAGGNNPQGCFDSVTSSANGQITVSGWAFDRDSLGTSLSMHVYVGGPAGSGAPAYAITANTYRPDVNGAYPGVGNYHGFSATINVSKTGTQTVYVYAINVGGGTENTYIGSKTVTIKGATTNNKAQAIASYAATQVGIGDSKGNNNVIYNTWFYGRTINSSGYAWCQAFVSYCANQVGVLDTAIPKTASCQTALKWFKNRGQYYKSKYYGGSYTPKTGDLVFYTSTGSVADHVGIITAAPSGGYLQVVEGNVLCSGGDYKVVKFTKNAKRKVTSSYVMGYASPNY